MVLMMCGAVLLIVFIAGAAAAYEGRTSGERCREPEIKIGVFSMDRAVEVWEGEGGAHRSVASKVMQSTRRHRTLWIRVLYALTIIVVLALVAKLQ